MFWKGGCLREVVTKEGSAVWLSPDMKMYILVTVLYTFLMELVRKIYLNTTVSSHLLLGDHFLYSHHLNV